MKKKKKKDCKPNPYNLWYIGQIPTIPNFIKDDIEKSIAQLSIWKCGLILDTDSQLKSQLELKGN